MGRLSYLPKLVQGGVALTESSFGSALNKVRHEGLTRFTTTTKYAKFGAMQEALQQCQSKRFASSEHGHGSENAPSTEHASEVDVPWQKTYEVIEGPKEKEFYQPPLEDLPVYYDTIQRFGMMNLMDLQRVKTSREVNEHLPQPGEKTYGHNPNAVYIHPHKLTYLPVDYQPWTGVLAAGMFNFFWGIAYFMHAGEYYQLLLGMTTMFYGIFFWCRDVVRENTFMGWGTLGMQQTYRYGMIVFIFSEFWFFFTIFWTWFNNSAQPIFKVMPEDLIIKGWGIPLMNTFILLSSGATLTWAHHAMVAAGGYARRTPK